MHDLGLVSVSFREHTPETIIQAASSAGLSCIEWGSDIHAPCTNLSRLEEIALLQKRAGLYCCSYGTYFRIGENDPEELRTYARAAAILGTRVLRVWCGTEGSAVCTRRETLLEDCRRAARIAEQCGVIVCMECHNNTLTDTKESALDIMTAVSSPAFRMYYQPNQLRTVSENLEYAKCLSPWVRHVHVFNWNCPDGKELKKYPLAMAADIWKAYLEALPQSDCLLLEFMPDNRIESLPQEADALRTIVRG